MRIVWLAVNSCYSHVSLALPLLHAASESLPGTEWDAVQVTAADDPAATYARVAELRPDVLAAGVYLFNRRFVLDVIARTKVLFPEMTVVLGGPEWLGPNEEFLRSQPCVDVLLRGEGEISFPELLRNLKEREKWPAIGGLCWLDQDGRYRDNGTAPAVRKLDSLPSPASDPFFVWDRPFVQTETSRGCAAGCTYCTSAGDRPVRKMSRKRIRKELRLIHDRGIREVRVLDRTFNAAPRRCSNLLEFFRTEFPDIRFHLEIDPGRLHPDVRRELSLAPPGHLHIEAGLQTSSRKALKAVSRPMDPEKAFDGIRFLSGLPDLEVHVDLLAGLPEQTPAGVLHDAAALVRLGVDEIQLEVLKILPGTPLREDARELRIIYSPVSPYEVLKTPRFSTADLVRVRMLSRVLDTYYNHPDLRGPCQTAVKADSGFLVTFTEYLTANALLEQPRSLQNRFRIFHAFVSKIHPGVTEELEINWMKAGFSPTHGICRAERCNVLPPENARLIQGSESALPSPNQRIWKLKPQHSESEFWFVYDKSISPRRPVAVYQKYHPEKSG